MDTSTYLPPELNDDKEDFVFDDVQRSSAYSLRYFYRQFARSTSVAVSDQFRIRLMLWNQAFLHTWWIGGRKPDINYWFFLFNLYRIGRTRSLLPLLGDIVVAQGTIWTIKYLFFWLFDNPEDVMVSTVYLRFLFDTPFLWDFARVVFHLICLGGEDDSLAEEFVYEGFGLLIYVAMVFICTHPSTFQHGLWISLAWAFTFLCLWIGAARFFDTPLPSIWNKIWGMANQHRNLFSSVARRSKVSISDFLRWTRQHYGTFSGYKNDFMERRISMEWRRPYKYEPIKDAQSIRLLCVRRKNLFGEFQCRILHTSLDKTPPYEAVSYTWGGQAADKKILVNNRSLAVTANVLEILQARASLLYERILWIDSVCINQKDLVEKGVQVTLMKDIYRNADQVLVWLGYAPGLVGSHGYISEILGNLKWSSGNARYFNTGALDLRRERTLRSFMNHTYWSRVWVIQEVAVAKNKILFSYGGQEIPWNLFKSHFNLLTQNPINHSDISWSTRTTAGLSRDQRSMFPPITLAIPLISNVRTIVSQNSILSLLHIIDTTRHYKATDSRDKIFALLGLVTDAGDPLLKPDYTTSVANVYTKAARHCFFGEPALTLAFAGIGSKRETPDLPSWVPDYACLEPMTAFTVPTNGSVVNATYHASGNTLFSGTLDYQLPVFFTQCILFDSIHNLGPLYTKGEVINGKFKFNWRVGVSSFLAGDQFARRSLGLGMYRFTNQSCDEVVWRTRMGDRAVENNVFVRPAPVSHGSEYAQKINNLTRCLNGTNDKIKASGLNDTMAAVCGMASNFRRLALSKQGTLCLVPEGTQVGDVIGVMKGGQACTVLSQKTMPDDILQRSALQNSRIKPDFRLVGECYVHGFMDGEALLLGRQWEEIAIR